MNLYTFILLHWEKPKKVDPLIVFSCSLTSNYEIGMKSKVALISIDYRPLLISIRLTNTNIGSLRTTMGQISHERFQINCMIRYDVKLIESGEATFIHHFLAIITSSLCN